MAIESSRHAQRIVRGSRGTWLQAGAPAARLAAGVGVVLSLLVTPLQATPDIQSWQTQNGARVLFVPAPDLPMLDIKVVFDAGSARDGTRSGLASLTATMLTEGAGDWDADALAERLDGLGAQLAAGADRDMAAVTLRSLTRDPILDQAVETLAVVLAAPRFAPDALERVRRNQLIALRQQEESPREVASKALYRAVFGDHPYAADPAGTPETLAAIGRDTISAFHQQYYVAANALIAMVGAVDRAGAERIAERLTAGLAVGAPPPALPEVAPLAAGRLEQRDFPSSQTTVLAGQPGVRRGDPDYFPLYVGNHILGGSGLISLLMKEIREKRGLSYSTYSYFLPLAKPGPFMLGLQTRNDQADAARDLLIDTLREFIGRGPTAAELTAAKQNITGGFPLRIASNEDILAYLAVIGFYRLPLSYLNDFNARIEAVTAEQVRDAFARRVDPERLAILMVGKRPETETPGEETPGDATPTGEPPAAAAVTGDG